MKSRTIHFLLVSAILVVGVSCSESFLEVEPQQSVSNEEALTNITDYEAAITGVYNAISSSNYYGRYFVLVPDVMSDDVKQNSQANRAKEYAEYSAYEEHFITQDIWEQIYFGINSANSMINNPRPDAIGSSLDADYNHIMGEAYALRALMYFDLVRLYGQHYTYTADASHLGVPLVFNSDDPFIEPTRNSVAEVYTQVLSDLTTAMGLISTSTRTGSTSAFSEWSVKALMARVYLYMEDWDNAQSYADDVIENGPYSLVDNAGYISAWTDDYSDESIFEIAMTETDNRGSDALGGMYNLSGYGDYLPSNDLYNLIPAGDVRLQLFVEDAGLTGDWAPNRLAKYPSSIGENNTKVIRLSEMYLIRAEAAAEQGETTGPQGDVDAIRQRGLPTAAAVTATGAALLDEIRLERRIELAYEGHRLWDLMRYQQDMVRTECTATVASACNVSYPNDRFVLPIPANEQDANPNIEPNPGY